MRCPKCHYLSFDPDPRCKNCGYGLDVETDDLQEDVAAPPLPDLPLRPIEPVASKPLTLELVKPLPPLRLPDAEAASEHTEPDHEHEPVLVLAGPVKDAAPVRRATARPAPAVTHPTAELPLFVKTMGPQEIGAFAGLAANETEGHAVADAAVEPEADVEVEDLIERGPMMPVPSTNRPLSVRRPVAEPTRPAPRVNIHRRPGPIDADLMEDLNRIEREEAIRVPRRSSHGAPSHTDAPADLAYESAEEQGDVVTITQRFGAAALDGLLLGGIAAFVLWATLKVADAAPSDLGVASLVPLGVFLAAVSIAYLLMFTAASGQTVGKMLMGIRVVAETTSDDDRLTLGQAASRAIMAPLSVLMLGLGMLPLLVGRGPALHDRVAHTRVVRA